MNINVVEVSIFARDLAGQFRFEVAAHLSAQHDEVRVNPQLSKKGHNHCGLVFAIPVRLAKRLGRGVRLVPAAAPNAGLNGVIPCLSRSRLTLPSVDVSLTGC